jgi:gamma-glutamyl-gamma-aminobutyrate hydrolase PuuD
MAYQTVYIVGPNNPSLCAMFAQQPEYRVTSDFKTADVFCFQGGADLHPSLYNERLLSRTSYNKERDKEDLEAWLRAGSSPKVGICRGAQFLNVMSEVSMWQHVDGHMGDHKITNLLDIPGTVFDQGMEIDITSDHHQMMVPNHHYAEILAISHMSKVFQGAGDREKPEYDTEVCFYNHTQALCFQPHPEYSRKVYTRTYFFKLMEFFYK